MDKDWFVSFFPRNWNLFSGDKFDAKDAENVRRTLKRGVGAGAGEVGLRT